jgi:DNA-directed RNA polymerase subunit RPC12/RpoP
VSVYPCSNCGQRVKGKLSTTYNAWFDESGERACYRQRLCVRCLTALAEYLKAGQSDSSLDVTACPVCGSDSSTSLDPIYMTVFVPQHEPKEFALTTCASCAGTLRPSLMEGASKMGDRGVGGGLGPHSNNVSEWDSVLP